MEIGNEEENKVLKKFKAIHPDKEYPSGFGKKWTDDEEKLLLDELTKNIDINLIAEKHKRSLGGIKSRIRLIAYKMHSNGISIEEIIKKTKIDKDDLMNTIEKRKENKKKGKEKRLDHMHKTITEDNISFSLENDIMDIKKDIKELKNYLHELSEKLSAIYEFEDD